MAGLGASDCAHAGARNCIRHLSGERCLVNQHNLAMAFYTIKGIMTGWQAFTMASSKGDSRQFLCVMVGGSGPEMPPHESAFTNLVNELGRLVIAEELFT